MLETKLLVTRQDLVDFDARGDISYRNLDYGRYKL